MRRTLTMSASLLIALPAAGGGETWTFDETTTGEDVHWTSPTPVNPAAALYQQEFQITLVEVDVTFLGFPINNVDVTDQVPPELLAGSGFAAGPAPVQLFDNTLEYPGPPDPPCLTASISIALDAAGLGHLDGTEIFLGTCVIDIGPVVLQSLRVVGLVAVTSLKCPWDTDGDGTVGVTDLLDLLALWGLDPSGPPDFDGDGVVAVTDLLELLGRWGPCPGV